NKDSDAMVNTFSSPIGISWTCVHDRDIGVCVWVGERHSACIGRPNEIFWIEVVGGTLDPKNWTKNWPGTRLPGNPLVGHWMLRTKGCLVAQRRSARGRSGSLRYHAESRII